MLGGVLVVVPDVPVVLVPVVVLIVPVVLVPVVLVPVVPVVLVPVVVSCPHAGNANTNRKVRVTNIVLTYGTDSPCWLSISPIR
jgi:hypothetical protein